jgi:xanthine dehydrogenase accessory factor
MSAERPLVLLRGGGDLGTGVALRLHRAGWRVLVTELPQPLVIRRTVAFAAAIYEGSIEVEGAIGERIAGAAEADRVWAADRIPVLIDPAGAAAVSLRPIAVIDAIMAKRNTGTRLADAPIVIALGPGFTAGIDCHAVIETQRGHHLGRVYYRGAAQPDSGTPGDVGGQAARRVLRAPVDGTFRALRQIGDRVAAGEAIGQVLTTAAAWAVTAQIDGVLRGILHDGLPVSAGLKVADVDPRGVVENCFTISDKAWAMGGAVLEAVMYLSRKR